MDMANVLPRSSVPGEPHGSGPRLGARCPVPGARLPSLPIRGGAAQPCAALRLFPSHSLGGGEYLPASWIQDVPSSEFSDLTEAVSKVFVRAPGGL